MLSLIIPVYNEAGAVEDIIRRSDKVLTGDYEIIVVDDGSTDATPGILKKIDLPSVRVIRHSKNKGNGASIMTGVRNAKGEYVSMIDADDTYQPEDIPLLYKEVLKQDADMIVGVRKDLMQGPFFHSTARNLLRKFAEFCSGTTIDDINSGMRICKKDLVLRYAILYPQRFSFHIVLMICAGKEGAKILYEPISYGPRIGVSKLSPGIRGPWNFIKFFVLIPWAAVKSKDLRKL
jgi:glycosyltransferase involved in cell wall biosynthesis